MPRKRIARLLRFLLCCSLPLWTAAAALAQPAELVADIDPRGGEGSDSFPGSFARLGGRATFTAYELDHRGRTLWATDGTPQGTRRLSERVSFENRRATLPGLEFWDVSRQPSGTELWRTDGTPEGTFRLAVAGQALGYFAGFHPLASGLYFFASRGAQPAALWRTDGTREGTVPILPLPASLRLGLSVQVRNQIYFVLQEPEDPETGDPGPWTLFRTDGTPGGTVAVRRFAGLPPFQLAAAGSRVVFPVYPLGNGENPQLWASDGTRQGTVAVTHFTFLSAFTPTRELRTLGGRVYFLADDGTHGMELWRSDGTPAGTLAATAFANPEPWGSSAGSLLFLDQLAAVGSRVAFPAEELGHGQELWVTGGTPASTAEIEICPGPCSALAFTPFFATTGGRIYFRADDGTHGFEPWSSDGTVAGTARLADVCAGACDGALGNFVAADGAVLFAGFDPEHETELWQVVPGDGVRRRTSLPAEAGLPFGETSSVARLGTRLVFAAYDRHGIEPWAVGASPESTRRLTDIQVDQAAGARPLEIQPYRDGLVFLACHGNQVGLWRLATPDAAPVEGFPLPSQDCVNFYNSYRSDDPLLGVTGDQIFIRLIDLWVSHGEPGDAVRLTDFLPDFGDDGFPEVFGPRAVFQGVLAFGVGIGYDPFFEVLSEIWLSDGTVAGTRPIAGLPSFQLRSLQAVGDRLYFFAQAGSTALDLWVTDGTAAGTVRLAAAIPWSRPRSLLAPQLVALGGRFYFASDGVGSALWETDGTAAGTRPVPATSPPAAELQAISSLLAFDGALYFLGTGGEDALFRYEPASGAVTTIADFGPAGFFFPGPLAATVDRLFWLAYTSAGGRLWTSDGTPGGTGPIGVPLQFQSPLLAPYPAGDRVFFTADFWDPAGNDRPVVGLELWTSDGTSPGTRLVQDLAPGIESSQPDGFTPLGDDLYFAAFDPLVGRELWRLPLALPPCKTDGEILCLANGELALQVRERREDGALATARPRALSEQAGVFSRSASGDPDLAVKVVDGEAVNGSWWLFLGGLSDRDLTLTMTDRETGFAHRYRTQPGRLSALVDLEALPAFGPPPPGSTAASGAAAGTTLVPRAAPVRRVDTRAAAGGACAATEKRLCLLAGRFAVEVDEAPSYVAQAGALELSGTAGAFFFRNPASVEAVVKLVDGTAVNGQVWIFATALTTQGFRLRVTDTVTGQVRQYVFPAAHVGSVADTAAFSGNQ